MYSCAQIGWRRFHPKRYDLQPPKWLSLVNIVWPTFVCLLIIISCVTQVLSCFRRDSVSPSSLSSFITTLIAVALIFAALISSS